MSITGPDPARNGHGPFEDGRPYTGFGKDGHGFPGQAIPVALLRLIERTGVWIPDRAMLAAIGTDMTVTYDRSRRAYLARIESAGADRLIVPGEAWPL